MELKDLEEMFKMEQELDIPHRDRWYNKDFDKRELEAEQSVKNCNIPHVSNSVCPKCGNTGRCEPRTLSDPDGQECDCGANGC